jgi:hypothetical protein
MREAAEFLKNLVFGKEYLKATIKEGVAALKPYAKDLEAVHIRFDHPDLSMYRPMKARGEIGDIDEHIMDAHYRPQAIEILRHLQDDGFWHNKLTRMSRFIFDSFIKQVNIIFLLAFTCFL